MYCAISVAFFVVIVTAFFTQRKLRRRKEEAFSFSLEPCAGKKNGLQNEDSNRACALSESDDDEDHEADMVDPVRAKYTLCDNNSNGHQTRNFLSTISEVSEETDSSVINSEAHSSESYNRILSESTYTDGDERV